MVIRAINRKLIRDLWHIKAQVLTIAFLICGGSASMVSALSAVKSLKTARDEFYIEGRFADVFSELKRAPLASLSSLEDKKSITEVQARVSLLGRLWKQNSTLPLTVRIQSYNNPTIDLNRLFLKSGRWPETTQNEIVINEAFYQGAEFRLGDEINVIAEGQNQHYKIVGVVISPEFIYTLKPGAPLPDDRHFGVLWGPYEKISKDFGYERAYNSVIVKSSLGYQLQNVISDLDSVLAKYGGLGAYGREHQLSHFFVTDELRQQRVTATIFPTIFLLVSGFLLNMILGRLVNSQREQIAIFRVLGYSNNKITVHYLIYVIVIVLLGNVFGAALGYWQGSGMINMYRAYFRFLNLEFLWSWPSIFLSLVVSFLFGVLGVIQIIWRLRQLQPSEALRPQIPLIYKGHGLDWFLKDLRLKPILRMTFRSLLNRPGRTLISMLGLSFSSVILVLGVFWWDSISFMISVHFNKVLKADTIVTFISPVSQSSLLDLKQNNEVIRAEGYRQIPVKIYFKNRNVLTTLEAVESHQQLKNLLDKDFHLLEVPQTGLLLSRGWADKLQVKVGDIVTVETLENTKRSFSIGVSKVVEDLVGSQAYIDRRLSQNLLQEGSVYNSILLKLDNTNSPIFLSALKSIPLVASVDSKLDILRNFNESTAKIILIFAVALVIFASLITVGVIYNTGRISLAEKSRILASLRILGFTHQEIFQILLGEIIILTIFSLPIGSALGYFIADLSVQFMRTESFRMPMHLEPRSFVYSTAVVGFSSLGTSLFLRKLVRELDIIATLKGQE